VDFANGVAPRLRTGLGGDLRNEPNFAPGLLLSRWSTLKNVRRNIVTMPIHKAFGADSISSAQDLLAVEEPLQIRVNDRDLSITMRTPGHDCELAAGFLFTEGVVKTRADVLSVASTENSVTLTLADGLEPGAARNFYTTSSCGVCGKASIESLHAAGCAMLAHVSIDRQTIHGLPEQLRAAQSAFDRTGGLHGAALFDRAGKLEMVREDVGRHNAVDKLIGAAFLEDRLPLAGRILMLSGRASFELVQKAVMAGIPVVAAVGAPSSLAVQTAMRFGMTLLGFVRDGRFNIYSGVSRLQEA
jgi:FdhD protein